MTIEIKPQEISEIILREKYAKGNEQNAHEIRTRVAKALAASEKDSETHAASFLQAMTDGFIPAGRVNSAAGTEINATLMNCFVQPVGDAMRGFDKNGLPGIMDALGEASETMRRGGGVGYDFSAIRPEGAFVKGTHSSASGPISYMRVFDSACQTVESAGSRRGAQMGVLRCDHPDIEAFIAAKAKPWGQKELTQFNISVGVTDAFMNAVQSDQDWELIHEAEPSQSVKDAGAYQREDGKWVYRTIKASEMWEKIMRATYDYADPGVLFLDRMNAENNLHYIEELRASNPCGEQPLPKYGCCCLGSINLFELIDHPFTPLAALNSDKLREQVTVAVRMLDNVLDESFWPLEQQREEAMSKRRIGTGFTALGDALIALGLRYNSQEGRNMAELIASAMRDYAYMASVELAKEKGAFPLFDADKYLASGFATRLPKDIRNAIRTHGIRNSHLLSIAPTGTISLAFADNASSGIEPAFSWHYNRYVRQPGGESKVFKVQDHAYRVYKHMLGKDDVDDETMTKQLPGEWVTALEMSAEDHLAMVAAVAPYIDTAISKTINVPGDYPYEDFKDIYLKAWTMGLKGITTYRPNDQVASVLSVDPTTTPEAENEDWSDHRILLDAVPEPTLASLRWVKRPKLANGNPCWTYMVEHPMGYNFGVFIGHVQNGKNHPFEVWVNGAEQPRGLGALAKSLSMDLRSNDRGWLKAKLEALMKVGGDDGFELPMPPEGDIRRVPSIVAGFAILVDHRVNELGAYEDGPTPVLNSLMTRHEIKSGVNGTMSWTVDITNPATNDDFVMGLKEIRLPNGQLRPYGVWLSGEYPKALDGLCKSLSYDMRVIDAAWIGAKLRQLVDYSEARGDFLARTPGSEKQANYPSTVAYMARLIIHRYSMLGVLDADGYPVEDIGMFERGEMDNHGNVSPSSSVPHVAETTQRAQPGKKCPECGNHTMIRKDGCDFCTSCGHTGSCG